MIWDFIVHLYSALALMPYATFVGIWIITYLVTRNKRKSTYLSMDATVFFLFGPVMVLMEQVTGSRLPFWIIVLLILISAGFIGREQNRKRGKVDGTKLFRWMTRTGFLLFSLAYVVLVIAGLVQTMMVT